jgi:putative DNA-invertase from lambdoid prophage Rac
MKAFLYARVSTDEQSVDMQVHEMVAYCERRGWADAKIFTDTISGSKERRPVLDSLMAQVRRGQCDVVLVYKFDRFARSLRHLLNALEEFESLNVAFVSLHDEFDMTTATGRLMFKIVGAFAEFERDIIRQRVRSGMAHAKAQGKHMGRKPLPLDAAQITALRAQGLPWREVAHRVKADESTVRKFMSGKRLSVEEKTGH